MPFLPIYSCLKTQQTHTGVSLILSDSTSVWVEVVEVVELCRKLCDVIKMYVTIIKVCTLPQGFDEISNQTQ